MEIIRHVLPLGWDEKSFVSYDCYNCGKDFKVLGIRAMKSGTEAYVYEIRFPNRYRFFLCEDCFKQLMREAVKVLL
jgi:DNA-directed RNA polymerase subunit RPC12/RpoP